MEAHFGPRVRMRSRGDSTSDESHWMTLIEMQPGQMLRLWDYKFRFIAKPRIRGNYLEGASIQALERVCTRGDDIGVSANYIRGLMQKEKPPNLLYMIQDGRSVAAFCLASFYESEVVIEALCKAKGVPEPLADMAMCAVIAHAKRQRARRALLYASSDAVVGYYQRSGFKAVPFDAPGLNDLDASMKFEDHENKPSLMQAWNLLSLGDKDLSEALQRGDHHTSAYLRRHGKEYGDPDGDAYPYYDQGYRMVMAPLSTGIRQMRQNITSRLLRLGLI